MASPMEGSMLLHSTRCVGLQTVSGKAQSVRESRLKLLVSVWKKETKIRKRKIYAFLT